MSNSSRVLCLLALCLVFSAAFVFLEVPGRGRLRDAIQNSGHGLAFALFAFASLLFLGALRYDRPYLLAATVSVCLFLIGVGIEFAQHLTGRGANLEDVGMNSLGIVAGVAAVLGQKHHCRGSRAHAQVHVLWWAISAFTLTWCLRLPIAIAVTDTLAPELPTLADFEQPFALAKFGFGDTPATLELIEAHADWPSNESTALEAQFPTGLWPGFRLIEPPSDWRAYRRLSVQVMNPSREPIRLYIRVDQYAAEENIFWTSSVMLEPGINAINVELADMKPDIPILDRPDHEPFLEVLQVLFFLAKDQRDSVRLLFDQIALSGD